MMMLKVIDDERDDESDDGDALFFNERCGLCIVQGYTVDVGCFCSYEYLLLKVIAFNQCIRNAFSTKEKTT